MNKKTKIIIFSIIAVLVLAIGSYFFYLNQLEPVSSEQEVVVFVVEESDNLDSITRRLEQDGIIKSAFMAKLHAKFNGISEFYVGHFELDKSWGTNPLLNYLANPDHAKSGIEATVTLIPGSWAKDMAKELEKKLDITSEELLTLWNDETYVKQLMNDYEFLSKDILNPDLNVKLEGYLAPETYNFFINADGDQITRRLLDQTNTIYQKYKEEFDKSEFSVHEIFTLASITQYESGKYEDDQIIAGVWYNRLEQGMKLESSVTVCYSLYEYDKWEDCETNIGIDSPFNTYKNAGIPIGPILNPGENSIKATLFPQESDYLFFIADVYGDGSVYYAKTLEEHQDNINKYLRK